MINVLLNSNVLNTGSANRGIGTYTRLLSNKLDKDTEINLVKSSAKKAPTDIIHYPFFDLFFDTLPLHLFKKTVVTIHDVIPLIFPKFYPSGIKGKLRFKKQKLALKNVNAIITDSKNSKIDIIKYLNVPEEKIHVIYLAPNDEFEKQDEKVIKKVLKKYNLPKNYFLYVGDINYNKNIPQLIKMMKFIEDKDIKLVCVGRNFSPKDIPEWKWIETQLALSNVEDRVIFVNNLLTESMTDLSAIYSGAIAYIQPSLYEGFGLPVLEAMRCQTPVISAKNSSLIEVGATNVLFAQANAEDFAQRAIEVISWSKTTRKKWLKKAFEWSQKFSWYKVAKETIAVYKKVIDYKE